MRYWISSVFQPEYNVVGAKNGRKALALLENLTPGLVLRDVNMPLLSGIELVKALRSHHLLGLVLHELCAPLHTIQRAADSLRNMPGVPEDLIEATAAGVHTLGSRIVSF